MYTAHLTYDPAFSDLGQWVLGGDGVTIAVKYREASGPPIEHTFRIADAKPKAVNAEDWRTAPVEVPNTPGETVFYLRGAPEHVAEALRRATA